MPFSFPFSRSAVEGISLCLSAENNDHCSGETHFNISEDKDRQSASRGLNQLPVAYGGANRKITTNNRDASYPTPRYRKKYPPIYFPL